jgi:hypothetical protein
MDIGEAMRAIKAGHRVARKGWNGKEMWLAYSPGCESLPVSAFWSEANKQHAGELGGAAKVQPCVTMKMVDDSILMGWLASQADLLADDWFVVHPATADDA